MGSGDKLASDISEQASRTLLGLTWQKGATALAVLVGSFAVAKLAGLLLRRSLSRGPDWSGPVFALSKLFGYLVVVIGAVVTMSVLGIPLRSLLLTSSALLIGIGFALQPIVRDFIAGIILLVEQPIRKRDFVTFGDTAGTVQAIGLRATHLLQVDGTDVIVPNHLLVTTEVANHSHPLPMMRLTVNVPVSLLEDVDVVRQTLQAVAANHPQVLDEPEPFVRLDAIGGSEFQFALVAWVRDPRARLRVASELRYGIAHAFGRAGVRFPTPELLLHTAPTANRQSADAPTGTPP